MSAHSVSNGAGQDPAAMAGIDLVIFDCDGVLIDSEAISARMLVAELAGRGVAIDLDYVRRHFLGRSYPVVLKQIRRDFGLDLPRDFEAGYRARLLAAFERELTVMPGVEAVLDALGPPAWLATSSSAARLARSLEIAGLAARFEGRVTTASEVAHGKPAPDLFLHAAAQAGAVPPRCLVIEDSLMGIAAARAAGMAVWHFTGGSHQRDAPAPPADAPRADATLRDFSEFFTLAPGLRREGGP